MDARDLDALNVRAFLEAAVAEAPDQPFLIHGEDSWTYAEFNRLTDKAARAWHDLGVRKGDRVIFLMENRPEFLTAWLGLAKIGGILVACNTRWQVEEVAYFLKLTEPRFALVSERFVATFRAATEGGSGPEFVLTVGGDGRLPDFASMMERADFDYPQPDLRADDLLTFISTSGTTGFPKAVMQTHGNLVLTGEGYATWVELKQGERIYLCLPLFHINSQAYSLMGAIAARATVVLAERFSAGTFWADMIRYGVDVFNYIGSMLLVLMKRDVTPEEKEHHVRLTYGGPALPDPLRSDVEERFHLTVISGIGMSETTFGLIEPLHELRRSGTLGKPRQHPDPRIVNEARVVDDAGHDVPTGEVGELLFRNPVMMAGYYRDPAHTAGTIRDGWLHTGDLVRRDEDGYFYFVDRKKDIIRVRGENVASAEVERILSEHEAVQDAAAVGVPSELTDEDVAAFVVPRAGRTLEPEQLSAWCQERLASFKVPAYIWVVDSLPKTETMRTEKKKLRQMAAAMRDAGTVLPGRAGS